MAEAFNGNNSILKILFDMKENALKEDYNATNETACGYGAGYGALPYFEGGVGANCHVSIFKRAGYEANETHGKHFDSYTFKR